MLKGVHSGTSWGRRVVLHLYLWVNFPPVSRTNWKLTTMPWIRIVVAALGERRDLFCFTIGCVEEGSLQMALLYERPCAK